MAPGGQKQDPDRLLPGAQQRPSLGESLFEPHGEEDKLMHIKGRFHSTIFGPSWSPLNAALAIMLALLFLILLLVLMNLTAQPAQGQTYKVLYTFTGRSDGAYPNALAMDRVGGGGALNQ
jgi:hypothetical protein